jgi:dephospho-CoA kinase
LIIKLKTIGWVIVFQKLIKQLILHSQKRGMRVIIGLTSFIGAGKTTVGDYLVKKGFVFYSLSDVIREEIRSRGLEITRDRLTEVGNELRKKFGSSVLADRIIEKISKEPSENYVIDSIRNPAEIEALKKRKDFKLLFVDAPIETRFKRIVERQREKDPQTFDDFKKTEEREMQSKDSSSQQLLKCKQMADIVIVNDSSVKALYKKIDNIIGGTK